MNKNKVPLWAPVLVMVAAVLLVTVSTGGADADKGGHGGSITVPDGVFGGTVMATVNPGGNAMVYAQCFQGGELVFIQYAGLDSNNQAMLILGPTQAWQGGDADCTAEEGYFGNNGRWRSIASTTFHVSSS